MFKSLKNNQKHQFAFHYEETDSLTEQVGQTYTVTDKDLHHRMTRVVKVAVGESFILFNKQYHALCELVNCTKKDMQLRILSCQQNKVLRPKITYFLPLLKKDALQEAVYSLAETGVNSIQLVVTQKSRASITDKEFDRLTKTIIAAAEQCKQYAYADILQPVSLANQIKQVEQGSNKFVFDVEGKSFFDYKDQIDLNSSICLLIGPEGGLTREELQFVWQYQFLPCLLTRTILRAVQAAAVSSALFRLS